MASTQQCLASLARLSIRPTARPLATSVPRFLVPSIAQPRFASVNKDPKKKEKKKKELKQYRVHRKDKLLTFSLCDAIRYIRAFEVGVPPASVKYEIAVKLTTNKRSAIVRSRVRLPHSVRSDIRVAVICREGSLVATEARMAGAVAVGEETLFQQIKDGNIDFNRLICHSDSLGALNKANLGRILGPKGLMPSDKTKTVTKDVKGLLRDLSGAEDYREREGVVRLPIGQLTFTPEQLSDNIKAFVEALKKDLAKLESQVVKSIDEIVLSSTHGPGFSLNGGFRPTDENLTTAQFVGPM
ncbi:hypothetical protein PspLS_02973 [Pyricularia sp. CBS 133598]|nr:hypothetical protein PspLS_02973 [Pyricularia sp. CBS 133598]